MKRMTMMCAVVLGIALPQATAQVGTDLLARWRNLDRAQQQELVRRHRALAQMSVEQREEILTRHQVLVDARERAIESLTVEEQNALAALPEEQRRRRLVEIAHDYVDREDARIRDEIAADDRGIAAGAAAPEALGELVRSWTEERLRDLADRGVLSAAEAERLLSLPPRLLGHELREMNKRRWLTEPPGSLRGLADRDRKRLAQLPPRRFLREARRLRGALPPPQEPADVLRRILAGARRFPGDPRPFGNPPPLLPGPLIERVLSIDERRDMAALPPPERGPFLGRILRERASAALAQRGEPPARLAELDGIAPPRLFHELMHLIEPDYRPEPPPWAPRHGPPPGRSDKQ